MRQRELPDYYRDAYGRYGLFRIKGVLRLAACRSPGSPLRILHEGETDPDGSILDLQCVWSEMESISRADRVWMASMRIGRKCSGCHQMPERSFFIGKYQLPLCARCTGIVIGHAVGLAVTLFHPVPFWSLIGTLPLMADGMVQKYTSYESTNIRRLVSGILYGFGMMSACIRGIRFVFHNHRYLFNISVSGQSTEKPYRRKST